MKMKKDIKDFVIDKMLDTNCRKLESGFYTRTEKCLNSQKDKTIDISKDYMSDINSISKKERGSNLKFSLEDIPDYNLISDISNKELKKEDVELILNLIRDYDDLNLIGNVLEQELGKKNSKIIMYSMELIRRKYFSITYGKGKIKKSKDILPYLTRYAGLEQECAILVGIDSAGKINNIETLTIGLHNRSLIPSMQEIAKRLNTIEGTLGFVLVHNHPNDNLNPSNIDIKNTLSLYLASALLGIYMFDHIIINKDVSNYYSFRENNKAFRTFISKGFNAINEVLVKDIMSNCLYVDEQLKKDDNKNNKENNLDNKEDKK